MGETAVGERTYRGRSSLDEAGLGLALAPALTPGGLDESPRFFDGFAAHPQALARGLVALADVTATRYFQFTPDAQRDPVLTAHGDRLRAECFSACNGVYARLDLDAAGLDGGEIGRGTTNVDLGTGMRRLLGGVRRHELLHLEVGVAGLGVSTPDAHERERPVAMPERWVRALGNAAELHRGMTRAFELDAEQTRQLITATPAASAPGRSGWLAPTRGGVRFASRPDAVAVRIAGAHRLSALRRVLLDARSATVYGSAETGAALIEVELPGGRIAVGLTGEPSRGHSGEGSLLPGIATPHAIDDAELLATVLDFEPLLEPAVLGDRTGLDASRTAAALAVLAASGRVGWDPRESRYFHRELPADAARIDRATPRLVSARRLVDEGAAVRDRDGWRVRSGDGDYLVRSDPPSCSCTWFLRHGSGRGPCKHLLAVSIEEGRMA